VVTLIKFDILVVPIADAIDLESHFKIHGKCNEMADRDRHRSLARGFSLRGLLVRCKPTEKESAAAFDLVPGQPRSGLSEQGLCCPPDSSLP
jgi:hypothetical protein